MKRLAFVLSGVTLLLTLPLGAAEVSAISTAVARLSDQEARFTQRFLPRGYKKEQLESGRVVFGQAPASRWTYEIPEAKTFVFDGTTSWMFVPADETVMVHEVSAEEKKRLPFFVLSDPGRVSEWYSIEGTAPRFTLTARSPEALLQTISIDLDDDGRIRSLAYVDSQGNRTSFDLTDWKPGKSNSDTFTFIPPPGVDVIEN